MRRRVMVIENERDGDVEKEEEDKIQSSKKKIEKKG